MAATATLGWADYLVIVIMLLISAGIGIYYRFTGGRQKTSEEYFAANKSMSIVPVAIALMVSFMSAITLLGLAAEMHSYGTHFVVINLSYGLGTPIAVYGFLPVFFKLQATSTYEYLELRFGKGARLVTSIVYWIQLVLYTGIVLYAPALALEATTNLSKTASIVGVGMVCAFYSSIGGIKAVLVTDVFQAILMFACLLVVIGTAMYNVGGLGEIWRIAEEGGRVEFDNFSLDPTVRHTWWNLMIGGFFTYLSLFGVNQVQVQRMLTVKNLRSAQIALWLNWPIVSCLAIVGNVAGLAVYSKYYNCDPLTEGRISSTDQLMPLYVMDTLAGIPGLPGLFVAGIFSAGLSTVSAALNSLAAITLEDYLKPGYKKITGSEFPLGKSTVFGKSLAFMFGILCIGVAFLAQFLGGVLQVSLTIFNVVGGPIVGMFTMGMFTESATQRGAVTGILAGLVFSMWIGFGQPRPSPTTLPSSVEGCAATNASIVNTISSTISIARDTVTDPSSYFYLYRISYLWVSTFGFLVTIIVGLLVSNLGTYFLKEQRSAPNPDLFVPWIAKRIRARRIKSTTANVFVLASSSEKSEKDHRI